MHRRTCKLPLLLPPKDANELERAATSRLLLGPLPAKAEVKDAGRASSCAAGLPKEGASVDSRSDCDSSFSADANRLRCVGAAAGPARPRSPAARGCNSAVAGLPMLLGAAAALLRPPGLRKGSKKGVRPSSPRCCTGGTGRCLGSGVVLSPGVPGVSKPGATSSSAWPGLGTSSKCPGPAHGGGVAAGCGVAGSAAAPAPPDTAAATAPQAVVAGCAAAGAGSSKVRARGSDTRRRGRAARALAGRPGDRSRTCSKVQGGGRDVSGRHRHIRGLVAEACMDVSSRTAREAGGRLEPSLSTTHPPTLCAILACDSGRNGASAAATAEGVAPPAVPPRAAATPSGRLLLGEGGWLAVRRSSGVRSSEAGGAAVAAAGGPAILDAGAAAKRAEAGWASSCCSSW